LGIKEVLNVSSLKSVYTHQEAIELVKVLYKKSKDMRYKALNRNSMKEQVDELVKKFNIIGKDIYE
jgi:thioredoxin-related protein